MFASTSSTLSFQQRLATIISIILIPPTISLITFSLLAATFEGGDALHRFSVAFVAVCFSGIFPMFYVLYLKRQHIITRYDVPIREQRANPYIISVFHSAFGFFLLLFMGSSVYVWSLMWCYASNTLILIFINKKWKISAHMMGLTGPLIMLSIIFQMKILIAIPIVFLLGWSRVALKVHSITEVIAGAFLGAFLTLLQLILILNYATDFFQNMYH